MPFSASTDRYLGRHSNIPECCIEFYISKTTRQLIRLNRDRGSFSDPAIQYVMCPKCLRAYRRGKLRPNKLHECNREPFNKLCFYWAKGYFREVEYFCTFSSQLCPVSPDYTV